MRREGRRRGAPPHAPWAAFTVQAKWLSSSPAPDDPGGLGPAFSSEDAIKWRLQGRGQSERWGKAGGAEVRLGRGGCSEERGSELLLARSSLRARVRWARFPEDLGAAPRAISPAVHCGNTRCSSSG